MKTLILASQSPRRKELLERCGIPFETMPADIDESIDAEKPLEKEIERLSYEKAKHILSLRPDAVVIGSDTIVAVDGRPLGKPHNRQMAERMLESNVPRVLSLLNREPLILSSQFLMSSSVIASFCSSVNGS